MPELKDATVLIGVAGLNGTGLTEGEKLDITTRLTDIEATTIPANSTDLGDFSATPATSGQIPVSDGTEYVPTTLDLDKTVAFALPFTLDGTGGTVPLGVFPTFGVAMPDACTITGYLLDGSNPIAITVERAPAASPLAYSTISGSETPTLTAAGNSSTSDLSLTTWTTSIGANDRIRVNVSSSSAEMATLTLLLTRTI